MDEKMPVKKDSSCDVEPTVGGATSSASFWWDQNYVAGELP